METDLPNLQYLPRQPATRVKNHWGEVVRQVRQLGAVAVTHHSTVDLVLLDAETYQRLVSGAAVLKQREQNALTELTSRFDARLAVLQQPDAASKLDAVMASKGKRAPRPKAHTSA